MTNKLHVATKLKSLLQSDESLIDEKDDVFLSSEAANFQLGDKNKLNALSALYYLGNEFDSKSGGWEAGGEYGTHSKESDHLLYSQTGAGGGNWVTSEKIDLTYINILYFDVDGVITDISKGCQMGIATTKTYGAELTNYIESDSEDRKIYEVDVTDSTGEWYVVVIGEAASAISYKVYGVWTDKPLNYQIANENTPGLLSPTDWDTFNSKQNVLLSFNDKSTDYTLTLSDMGKIIDLNDPTSPIILTVPLHDSVEFPIGSQIGINQLGEGAVEIKSTVLVTGTDDTGTADKLSDTGAFTESESVYLGRLVHNKTEDTYAIVTGKDSDNILSLSENIMNNTNDYDLFGVIINSAAFPPYKLSRYLEATLIKKNNDEWYLSYLNTEQIRKTTTSTSDPSGGNDGDIWLKYEVEV